MVTIVKFRETPKYRCPVKLDDDNGNKLEQLGIPSDRRDILRRDVNLVGEYGPATYKDLVWVGQISEVFMESWVLNANGKALRRGNRKDLLQVAQVQISIGQLLPVYQGNITLDMETTFRSEIGRQIKGLAVYRCAEWVKWYKKSLVPGTRRVTETTSYRNFYYHTRPTI